MALLMQVHCKQTHSGKKGYDLLNVVARIVGFGAHFHQNKGDLRVWIGCEPIMSKVQLVSENQANFSSLYERLQFFHCWNVQFLHVAFVFALRHRSEQYFTSFQQSSHFFRQENGLRHVVHMRSGGKFLRCIGV